MMLKVINIIKKYQQENFTGKLIFKASNSIVWRLYFFSGQIFWINGGYHPHRFWLRNISYYFPHIDIYKIQFCINEELECIYYQLLYAIKQQNLITEAEANRVILNRISDIFFDLLQQSDIGGLKISKELMSLKDLYNSGFRPSSMGINFSKIQIKVLHEYKKFKSKFVNNISLNYAHAIFLNYAPIILKSQELEACIDPHIYQNLKPYLNGNFSLRDIGCYLQQDAIDFACSLIPYLNANAIKLIPIDSIKLIPIETIAMF